MKSIENTQQKIFYSCYDSQSIEAENFIPEHIFGYIISGSLTVYDGKETYHFQEGDFRFFQRNHLAKFTKTPPNHGDFKSISVFLDKETLHNISLEYDIKSKQKSSRKSISHLVGTPLIQHYIDSLKPYLEEFPNIPSDLVQLKVKEAVLLLIKEFPDLKNILFDFSAPGKIDLKAFMQQHFQFNVNQEHFAYLTGRSVATFKRDFQREFGMSSSKWLKKRRLEEAYFLLHKKGKTSSEIYLEVGFENLSHFSYAFKEQFGFSPSNLADK